MLEPQHFRPTLFGNSRTLIGRAVINDEYLQTVKAGSLHANGYDGAKSVNGRKRHLLVDTLGLVLSVLVTSANVPERKGLSRLLQKSRYALPRLHHLWLDRGYKGVAFVKRILLCFGVVLGIVARRSEKHFGLQARRWVVERTFA